MSLFPAYGQDHADNEIDMQVMEMSPAPEAVSPAREAQLLESDCDEEPPAPPPPPVISRCEDFYLDPKLDYGNLRVSTLYYPGRPQYSRGGEEGTLGLASPPSRRGRKRRARYFDSPEPEPPRADAELDARVAAFRTMIADAPQDVDLWLKFIRFQERCAGLGAALATAVEAVARAPHSRALHAAHHALARRHLPPDTYLSVLRDHLVKEKSPAAQCEVWARLLDALARSPAACSGAALAAAARAAAPLAARHAPHAYPHLLAAYGFFLRAAGLWELLVMLVELVAVMSFPPSGAFPPRADAARDEEAERRLLRLEDEVARSGLPLSARWVRVERARAAAHWRAGEATDPDPQRAPDAAGLVDLLLPGAETRHHALLLAATLLRLAKVPMMPASGGVRAAFSLGAAGARDGCAEALLPLLRAARRLPPAHPARPAHPAAAARLLALLADPPVYLTDDHGFLSWVNALWAACLEWTSGEARVALLCWRLRWLHALALLVDPETEEGRAELRRVRNSAKASLRLHAGASALPFAQFSRLELACGGAGGAGGATAAAAAARHAARAALRDPAAPPPQRLYVARVATETPGLEVMGTWATVCAVLGRPLPGDEAMEAPPPPALLEDALQALDKRCAEIEDTLDDAQDDDASRPGEALCAALLPGAGEWPAARARLAPPARRHQLFLRAAASPPAADASAWGRRYREQEACALAAAGARSHSLGAYARRLAPHHPHNAFLALAASGLAASSAADAEARRQEECGALAELLPPMLRAVHAWEGAEEAEAAACGRAAARTARRVARAGGAGAPAWAALLEAAARAPGPALHAPRAALHAVDACPAHKWLYVRGAAWGGDAGGAADVLLDKGLRLHALPDELDAAAAVAVDAAARRVSSDADAPGDALRPPTA